MSQAAFLTSLKYWKARKDTCSKWTYNYFEVVAGDDSISILDPLDSGSWWPWDLALKHDVHGLVGVDVGRPLDKLGRNCGNQIRRRVKDG